MVLFYPCAWRPKNCRSWRRELGECANTKHLLSITDGLATGGVPTCQVHNFLMPYFEDASIVSWGERCAKQTNLEASEAWRCLKPDRTNSTVKTKSIKNIYLYMYMCSYSCTYNVCIHSYLNIHSTSRTWCFDVDESCPASKARTATETPVQGMACHGGRTIGRHVRIYFGHCQALSGFSWLVPARLGETWKLQAFAVALIPFQSLSPKILNTEAVFFVFWAFEVVWGTGIRTAIKIDDFRKSVAISAWYFF